MGRLTISQVASQAGLRASAIRYYEDTGILPQPQRIGGQRRYDQTVLYRLAVLRRAQDAGFSLDEIRHLFFGFGNSTPLSARWKKLAVAKIAELEEKMNQIRIMKDLILRLQSNCRCETVNECGARILARKARAG